MITDRELICSDKQTVTADAVSVDSIYVGGLFGADRGRHMRAFCQVEASFTPDANATGITFEVIAADDGALTSNVVSLYSVTVPNGVGNAGLANGKRVIDIPLPPLPKDYLGFRYTTNAGDYTTGKVTAGIVCGTDVAQSTRPYAESHGF